MTFGLFKAQSLESIILFDMRAAFEHTTRSASPSTDDVERYDSTTSSEAKNIQSLLHVTGARQLGRSQENTRGECEEYLGYLHVIND